MAAFRSFFVRAGAAEKSSKVALAVCMRSCSSPSGASRVPETRPCILRKMVLLDRPEGSPSRFERNTILAKHFVQLAGISVKMVSCPSIDCAIAPMSLISDFRT